MPLPNCKERTATPKRHKKQPIKTFRSGRIFSIIQLINGTSITELAERKALLAGVVNSRPRVKIKKEKNSKVPQRAPHKRSRRLIWRSFLCTRAPRHRAPIQKRKNICSPVSIPPSIHTCMKTAPDPQITDANNKAPVIVVLFFVISNFIKTIPRLTAD